jgi:hypothetical protein
MTGEFCGGWQGTYRVMAEPVEGGEKSDYVEAVVNKALVMMVGFSDGSLTFGIEQQT